MPACTAVCNGSLSRLRPSGVRCGRGLLTSGRRSMPEISGICILTAFLAGAISFLSPCVLPLVPGYVSYIAGRSVAGGPGGNAAALRLPAVGLSACFILGFSTVFILLGASATALGQQLLAYRYELNFRSEEHTSELQSLMRTSYAVFCL